MTLLDGIDLVAWAREEAEKQLGALPYLKKRCGFWLMADEIERLNAEVAALKADNKRLRNKIDRASLKAND